MACNVVVRHCAHCGSLELQNRGPSELHAPRDYGRHRLRETASVPVLRAVKVWRCGAGFITAGLNWLVCFGAREKGTCDNRLSIGRDEVEARVLKALQEKL